MMREGIIGDDRLVDSADISQSNDLGVEMSGFRLLALLQAKIVDNTYDWLWHESLVETVEWSQFDDVPLELQTESDEVSILRIGASSESLNETDIKMLTSTVKNLQCLSFGEWFKTESSDSGSGRPAVKVWMLIAVSPLLSTAVLGAMQTSNVAHSISEPLLPTLPIAPSDSLGCDKDGTVSDDGNARDTACNCSWASPGSHPKLGAPM